jgi:Family of unknown function (DUF6491)
MQHALARLFAISLMLGVLPMLAACSGIPKREDDRETVQRYLQYAGTPIDRFSKLGGFSGWRSLDRDQLVVWTGINKAYLLRIATPCEDPRFVNTIGVDARGGSQVSTFDSIIVGDDRCRILEIREVDYKRMKQDARDSQ